MVKNRKISAALECARFMAKVLGIQVLLVSRHDLNMYTCNRPHQGLALDCSPLDFDTINNPPVKFQAKTKNEQHAVWLVLDEVTDVQNFGAIVRSAFFLGVDGIIVSSKKTAPINAFSSKASAGAIEYIGVYYVTNMPHFLSRCCQDGWSVLGGDRCSGAVCILDHKVKNPTMLVLGSEGAGLRKAVRRVCTGFVSVTPGKPHHLLGNVDSLNVSVAAGILMHQLISNN